jgi:formyltetrahydrofolate-dependent phosphoribosylglycinamide formyltransferase
MSIARLAVLASGSGSNFEAICQYFAARKENAVADVVLLVTNNSAAGAVARARKHGVPSAHLQNVHDAGELSRLLQSHRVDIVALAGYVKLVPADVVRAFSGRMLNIHPALLPDFGGPGMYGARVHQAVLNAGRRESGATVHLVSEEYDRGAILAQWRVPVRSGDTAQTLGKRVLAVEHVVYPRVLEGVALGTVSPAAPWSPTPHDRELLESAAAA